MSTNPDERGTVPSLNLLQDSIDNLVMSLQALQREFDLIIRATSLVWFMTMDDLLWEDSPFSLGENTDIVGTYQVIIGMPETNVWTTADEDQYRVYVERANWMILNAHVELPKNWWGSYKRIVRTI